MEKIRKAIRTRIGRLTLGALLLSALAAPRGADLTLTSPLDYQVIQRSLKDTGHIPIAGSGRAKEKLLPCSRRA